MKLVGPTECRSIDLQGIASRGCISARSESRSIHKDSLMSAKSKSSLGGLLYKAIFFIPNLILEFITRTVKSVFYVLSCCQLCKDESDPKKVQQALGEVAKIWKKADVTPAEKKRAFESFCQKFPEYREKMKQEFVAVKRNALLGKEKHIPAKIQDWNNENAQKVRQEAEKRIQAHDASLISSLILHLEDRPERKKD